MLVINSSYGKSQMHSQIKTSAGQYTISQEGIDTIKIPMPPLELQNIFGNFVVQINKSKLAIQKSLDKLEILQKSLMQQYFG